jgi:hypothetical protein
MTIDELQHLFRFQTTTTADYTPNTELEYVVINDRGRQTLKHPADQLEGIVSLLNGLVFEGYRDRTPIFVKPEA